MGDEVQTGIAEFGEIVRRDRCRHADRDALRAVGEHVREGGGEHDRLLLGAGVIVAEIDRILVDPFQQKPRDLGHPRFGVAVGGRAIAVDIAEITLPVDERIARGEVLRETHQGIVDRLIAVRVERAHHVADDLRAFAERRARIEPQHLHPVENATMHGLQSVASVRQRAAGNGRQRIGEIPLLQRLVQRDGFDAATVRRRREGFGHGNGLGDPASDEQGSCFVSRQTTGTCGVR